VKNRKKAGEKIFILYNSKFYFFNLKPSAGAELRSFRLPVSFPGQQSSVKIRFDSFFNKAKIDDMLTIGAGNILSLIQPFFLMRSGDLQDQRLVWPKIKPWHNCHTLKEADIRQLDKPASVPHPSRIPGHARQNAAIDGDRMIGQVLYLLLSAVSEGRPPVFGLYGF